MIITITGQSLEIPSNCEILVFSDKKFTTTPDANQHDAKKRQRYKAQYKHLNNVTAVMEIFIWLQNTYILLLLPEILE